MAVEVLFLHPGLANPERCSQTPLHLEGDVREAVVGKVFGDVMRRGRVHE